MLSFFYRKQKLFILVVFISLVCSLIGYGLHNILLSFQDPIFMDKEIAFITKCGKKVPKYHLTILTNFLSKESQDFSEKLENWNFLNEGIVSKFFLLNKCGEEIFMKLTPHFKEKWQKKFLKEKEFKGYTNSEMPIISVQNVWKKFSQKLLESFDDFISLNEGTSLKAFRKKVCLFWEQRNFPGFLIRQIINYQENNYKCLPSNYHGSFNVFNYENLQDWFGEEFLERISKIIIELAGVAKKQGLVISKEEIKVFSQEMTTKAFDFLKDKGFLDEENFYQFYNYYIQSFFLSEKVFFEVLEDILLFKKLLGCTGDNLIYDYGVFKEFLEDINKSFNVTVCSFPSELIFNSKEYLDYFETYLKLVGENRKDPLDLPGNYLDISEIKKVAPQLIGSWYQLKISHIHIKELENLIPLKEVFDWLMIEKNISILNKAYPNILFSMDNIMESYFALGNQDQKDVINFVKNDLISKNKVLIESKLREKMAYSSEYFISDEIYPKLVGIKNHFDFESTISNLKDSCVISQDNQNYYLVEKLLEKNNFILEYKDALRLGILKKIVANGKIDFSFLLDRLREEYGNLDEEVLLSYRLVKLLSLHRDGNLKGELIQQWLPKIQERVVKKSDLSKDEFAFLSMKDNLKKISPIFSSKEKGSYYYLTVSPAYSEISSDKIISLQNEVQFEIVSSYLLSFIKTLYD